jgi:ribonuclease P protein component
MDKNWRLRKNSDFKYVYSTGKVNANNLLVMYVVPNKETYNRVGFSVSKKVGKSVVRNKVRRRIKESYRINSHMIEKGYNIIFVSRVRANEASFREIEKAMISLFKKANILIDER